MAYFPSLHYAALHTVDLAVVFTTFKAQSRLIDCLKSDTPVTCDTDDLPIIFFDF